MAVAIMVSSDPLNPSSMASVRPFWRAVTMSTAELTSTWLLSMTSALFLAPVQIREPFLEIERRAHAFQREAQLNHRKGDVGLDADDDGFGSAQFQHVRNRAQGPGREGIDDVENRDINDHAARADEPHAVRE